MCFCRLPGDPGHVNGQTRRDLSLTVSFPHSHCAAAGDLFPAAVRFCGARESCFGPPAPRRELVRVRPCVCSSSSWSSLRLRPSAWGRWPLLPAGPLEFPTGDTQLVCGLSAQAPERRLAVLGALRGATFWRPCSGASGPTSESPLRPEHPPGHRGSARLRSHLLNWPQSSECQLRDRQL